MSIPTSCRICGAYHPIPINVDRTRIVDSLVFCAECLIESGSVLVQLAGLTSESKGVVYTRFEPDEERSA